MPLAQSSLDQYNKKVDRLKRETGCSDIFDTSVMIPAIKNLRKNDGGEYVPTALRDYFIALTYMSKENPKVNDLYKAEVEAMNKKIREKQSTEESIGVLPYNLIQRYGKLIMDNIAETLENRILGGMVTQMEPLRLDYANLFINPPEGYKGNYIRLGKTAKTSELVVQKHKTAKTYGALRRTLIEPIFHLLHEWYMEHPDRLFLNITESGLSHKISSLFKRYSKTKITMNDIRHSYITEARKGDRTKKEVEKIAHALGHSASMNMDYRRD
jgi:hypothetical protein